MSVQVQHRRDVNTVIETVTPAAGELGFDTTKKEPLIGDGTTLGGVRIQKKNIREILAPAQIVANTNDYNPTGLNHAAALRLTTDASRNLTGLQPKTATDSSDGREIELYNAGSFNLVVQDQNASSAAANRFDLGGADITLAPKQAITLRYSSAITRWEIVGGSYGQAISDGAVSARKLATSALGAFVGAVNATIVESHAGSAATFALKTLAGADPSATDPVFFAFQTGAGGFAVRTVTAALSLTISSGSSMGFTNGVPGRLWIIGIDTGTTAVLGAVNVLSGTNIMPLHQGIPISSTAEGGAGAADLVQTIYSAAAQASKFMCLLAYADYDSGLASAGAWVVSPTRMVMFGPGVPRPGELIQTQRAGDGAVATGTTLLPVDDTIPQNTEGDQYYSQAITPLAKQNVLEVETLINLASSANSTAVAAIFQDSTANALAANDVNPPGLGNIVQLAVSVALLANTLISTTFKVRAGFPAAGTTTVNGASGARRFGGVQQSYIKVAERMA